MLASGVVMTPFLWGFFKSIIRDGKRWQYSAVWESTLQLPSDGINVLYIVSVIWGCVLVYRVLPYQGCLPLLVISWSLLMELVIGVEQVRQLNISKASSILEVPLVVGGAEFAASQAELLFDEGAHGSVCWTENTTISIYTSFLAFAMSCLLPNICMLFNFKF